MLSVKNLTKTYPIGKNKRKGVVKALDNVSIDFPETGLVFLLGKSGSGKSTLLNSIGGLDSFDSGEIIIKGKSSKDFSQSDFDSYRNTFIGFIFQEYNILENFTVAKNLALAIELQGKKPNKEEINNLLSQVEMLDYAKRKPNQLSGGQKQRVAIARALIKNPEIIMADEPTGALDSNTGKQVMETLKNLSKTKLVIIVSHDREFAEIYGDRIIELKDGKIISDTTKKEVEAKKTSSGVSVVDGKFIHIKKGQNLTKEDYELILKQIQSTNKESDVIVSLNEETNKTVKKAEFITEDGNEEAFLKTEPEDIKKKDYNGKSLKLIKSHLKFSDSFKMGTSALKNKVGKLVFTILLSFFAFTVFGIVDALSCWNRAESVYQAMQISGQKAVVLQKQKKGENYTQDKVTKEADLKALREKFPNYIIKGAVKGDMWSTPYVKNDVLGVSYELENSQNPYKDTTISAFTYFTEEELAKLGFTLEGRLPQTDDEICISKLEYKNLKEATQKKENKIESFENLKIRIGYDDNYYTIVGVVDDKTDLSKYENMDSQKLLDNSYIYRDEISKTYAKLCYVTENRLNELSQTGNDQNLSYKTSDNSTTGFSSSNFKKFEDLFAETKDELTRYGNEATDADVYGRIYDNLIVDFVGGKEKFFDASGNFVGLKDDEILAPQDFLNSYIAEWETKLAEGAITINFGEGYDSDADVVMTVKIVGVTSSYNWYMSASGFEKNVIPVTSGYSYILTALNNTSEDKEFIVYCENFNSDNVRFIVENSATSLLNMFEDTIMYTAKIFMYVAIAFAVFAALMLMNFIGTSIAYKKREIGVLRALGARGIDIFGIFFNESTVIALINFALAAIATIVGCNIINSTIINKLGYSIALLNVGIRQILLILVVSWGSAFIASLIPTTKISRKKPIDAINNR